MKQVLDSLGNIQFDHSRWLNELIFSSKEMDLYQKRLRELIYQTNEQQQTEELTELFEDFEELKKKVVRLQLIIRKHVINNSRLVHSNGSLKTMINSNHSKARLDMEIFRIRYAKLKVTFHRFAALQD